MVLRRIARVGGLLALGTVLFTSIGCSQENPHPRQQYRQSSQPAQSSPLATQLSPPAKSLQPTQSLQYQSPLDRIGKSSHYWYTKMIYNDPGPQPAFRNSGFSYDEVYPHRLVYYGFSLSRNDVQGRISVVHKLGPATPVEESLEYVSKLAEVIRRNGGVILDQPHVVTYESVKEQYQSEVAGKIYNSIRETTFNFSFPHMIVDSRKVPEFRGRTAITDEAAFGKFGHLFQGIETTYDLRRFPVAAPFYKEPPLIVKGEGSYYPSFVFGGLLVFAKDSESVPLSAPQYTKNVFTPITFGAAYPTFLEGDEKITECRRDVAELFSRTLVTSLSGHCWDTKVVTYYSKDKTNTGVVILTTGSGSTKSEVHWEDGSDFRKNIQPIRLVEAVRAEPSYQLPGRGR